MKPHLSASYTLQNCPSDSVRPASFPGRWGANCRLVLLLHFTCVQLVMTGAGARGVVMKWSTYQTLSTELSPLSHVSYCVTERYNVLQSRQQVPVCLPCHLVPCVLPASSDLGLNINWAPWAAHYSHYSHYSRSHLSFLSLSWGVCRSQLPTPPSGAIADQISTTKPPSLRSWSSISPGIVSMWDLVTASKHGHCSQSLTLSGHQHLSHLSSLLTVKHLQLKLSVSSVSSNKLTSWQGDLRYNSLGLAESVWA